MCLLAVAFVPSRLGHRHQVPHGAGGMSLPVGTPVAGGIFLTPLTRGVTSHHHKFGAPHPFLTCALVCHVDLGVSPGGMMVF